MKIGLTTTTNLKHLDISKMITILIGIFDKTISTYKKTGKIVIYKNTLCGTFLIYNFHLIVVFILEVYIVKRVLIISEILLIG